MRRYHLRFRSTNYIYPLGKESVMIGRADHCDITLHDKRMSREHAKIFPAESGWWLLDLGSENGTFVDDEQITSAKLTPGCKIRFDGEQECYFEPGIAVLDDTDVPKNDYGRLEEHFIALRAQLTGLADRIDSVEAVAAAAKKLSEDCAAEIKSSNKAVVNLIKGGKRVLVCASVAGALFLGAYTSSTLGSQRTNPFRGLVEALGGPETVWSGLGTIALGVAGVVVAKKGPGEED